MRVISSAVGESIKSYVCLFQFSQWVDAVIFVFSLENERSFAAIYSFYAKMAHYLANLQDIPIILVGTQDAISESNPRLIDDSRARKLASDLRRCSYYETCATYGLNVERVFQDGQLNGIASVWRPFIHCVLTLIVLCVYPLASRTGVIYNKIILYQIREL